MTETAGGMNRRTFLNNSVKVIGGGAALGTSALSYGRIAGANDRISIGHIGIGNRGTELDEIASRLKQSHHVEMTAVCDLWSVNREKALATNEKFYGKAPRAFKEPTELLASRDLDAVIISTPEHSHSPLLKLAVEAGKDVYVEKPMGNVLSEVKSARDMVLQSKRIVQVGTQHRSLTRNSRVKPYRVARLATSARLKSYGTITARDGVDAKKWHSFVNRIPTGPHG